MYNASKLWLRALSVDGIINLQIAQTLATGKGRIHGVDSSEDMIKASKKAAAADPSISEICTFEGICYFPCPLVDEGLLLTDK